MMQRITVHAGLVTLLILLIAGCSSKPSWEQYQNGTHLVIDISGKGEAQSGSPKRVVDVMQRRLKAYGVDKYLMELRDQNRLVLQIPFQLTPSRKFSDLILKPYRLEFRLVNASHIPDDELPENVPKGFKILYSVKNGQAPATPYMVAKQVVLTGNNLADARVSFDPRSNKPQIAFTLDKDGARVFEDFTSRHMYRTLAIIVDNEVYVAPRIQAKISGGRGIISGNFSEEEAGMLAICLRLGCYPHELRLVEKKRITKELWIGSLTNPQ